MSDGFSEPVDWPGAVFALAIWLAHFTLLWGASSAFPHEPVARWIALAGTLAGLAALGLLRRVRAVSALRSVPGLAIALAAVAMLFGALPALVG